MAQYIPFNGPVHKSCKVFSFYCPFVSQQDYTKNDQQTSMKLGRRMGSSPEQTPLTFKIDPSKRDGPGIFSHLL